jgi:hypothetical protein
VRSGAGRRRLRSRCGRKAQRLVVPAVDCAARGALSPHRLTPAWFQAPPCSRLAAPGRRAPADARHRWSGVASGSSTPRSRTATGSRSTATSPRTRRRCRGAIRGRTTTIEVAPRAQGPAPRRYGGGLRGARGFTLRRARAWPRRGEERRQTRDTAGETGHLTFLWDAEQSAACPPTRRMMGTAYRPLPILPRSSVVALWPEPAAAEVAADAGSAPRKVKRIAPADVPRRGAPSHRRAVRSVVDATYRWRDCEFLLAQTRRSVVVATSALGYLPIDALDYPVPTPDPGEKPTLAHPQLFIPQHASDPICA